MADINDEIAAYGSMQQELEANHTGKWVIFQAGKLVGVFESFEIAAETAVKLFASGPYLIRQVGAPPVVMPASVLFNIRHA